MGCTDSKFLNTVSKREEITIVQKSNDAEPIDLNDYDISNVKNFTFNGIVTDAKVVDIINGDTCKVLMNINNQPNIYSIKMYGYNAPNIKKKSSNYEARYARYELACLVTSISEIINENTKSADITKIIQKHNKKIIQIHLMDFDRYDTIYAKIYLEDQKKYVNDIMIENGVVYPYNNTIE
jgi:endonuclease YncB( thermonuclease family)